jgi:hypothetical protein
LMIELEPIRIGLFQKRETFLIEFIPSFAL